MSEHFVLDTGPLVEYLVRSYQYQTGETWLRGVDLQSLKSDAHRVLFQEFLARHEGRLIICSGIVTQVERHVQIMEAHCPSPGLRAAFRAKFWALVHQELNKYRVDEKPVTLGSLEESLVARFGPVDASIILLAATARTGDRHVVVTDDRPLAGVCRKRQIPVQSVDSILEWMSGRSTDP